MSQPELVRLDVSGPVATITLDSPANRNALSRALVAQLRHHLRTADGSEDIRVILLTHTGGTFCAGADLAEAVEIGMEEGTRSLLALLRHLTELSTPVVAVVHGHVRAGGLGLVGACDLALVTDESTFAFSESLLGLTPAIISLTTRSKLSERDAARLYLTGETFPGAEAARIGLVTAATTAGDLDEAVSTLVADEGAAQPRSSRAHRRRGGAPRGAVVAVVRLGGGSGGHDGLP
jgi:enoyl-CoA hydratase/carnithine racemase